MDLFWAKHIQNVVFDGGVPVSGQNKLLSATGHMHNRSCDIQVMAEMSYLLPAWL